MGLGPRPPGGMGGTAPHRNGLTRRFAPRSPRATLERMRSRSFVVFLGASAAVLAASACNLIFSIEPGEPAGGGGHGTTTTSSTTGGSAPCAPGAATCEGAVLHCDESGAPRPVVTCDAVAACDAAAGACVEPATRRRLGVGTGRGCAIEDDGSVRCWGMNNGALVPGDSRYFVPSAKPVDGATLAWQVAVGAGHACIVRKDGGVVCWGSNDDGEAGVPLESTTLPTAVSMPGGRAAVEIAAAQRCSCARLDDGAVACWGQRETGCFGDVPMASKVDPTPTLVPDVAGAVELRVGVYETPTCARLRGGQVKCWGVNAAPQAITGVDDAIGLAVARGTVFIQSRTKGLLWSVPEGEAFSAAKSYGLGGTAIAGGDSLCVLRDNGAVDCAIVGAVPPPQPSAVPTLPDGKVVEIAAGRSFSYGLGLQCLRVEGAPIAGRVYCWGDDSGGAVGAGAPENFPTPQAVPTVENVAKISAAQSSTTAVLTTGQVVVWGQTSALPGAGAASPMILSTLGTNNAIDHTHDAARLAYVVKTTGALELFDSGTPSAERLAKITATDFISARSFAQYDLALRSSGLTVYGADDASNASGIFGDGTNTAMAGSTATITSLTDVQAFAAFGNDYGGAPAHACAIHGGNGSRSCWGNNLDGEVGSGPLADSVNTPTKVTLPNAETAVSIAVGARFSCAVSSAGLVYCWGRNDSGQLGVNPGTPSYAAPHLVPGVSGAVGVTAHESHVCAWLTDKTVSCWGSNYAGQVGDGTFEDRYQPAVISGLTGVVEASAGPYHVCARLDTGHVSCWGSSYNGQIGTGVTGLFQSPQMVKGL